MTHKQRILQGSASNMSRIVLSMLVALVLPPLLVHRLVPAEYSAWVLILQCSAYVSLLDLGLQTAISKFVAEYDALGDRKVSGQILSSSFAILCVSAIVGAAGVALITWRVPQLFHQTPAALVSNLREGILVIGLSAVFSLPFGAFLAVFTGLQRYGFPTILALISKLLSSATLAGLLLMHGTLLQLVWVMAAFNVATAVGQFFGWKRYANERVGFSWLLVDRKVALRLIRYGSVLSLWAVAGLFISGLDMVVVGHYDYKDTGYYGIASAVTNFMVLVIGSMLGPLLPAVSSLQSGRTPSQIGELTVKATRYCTLLLCFVGLPLIFGAYPLLKLWVGHDYAIQSALFLQILVLGNAIRQLGHPYAMVSVATGKQHLATLAGLAEAIVNISVSIYLVQAIGAVGVAIGTLVGSFVSLGVHIFLSMKFTRTTISMSRRRLVLVGFLQPLSCLVPSILLLPYWGGSRLLPVSAPLIAVWIISTSAIGWFIGLTSAERDSVNGLFQRLINPPLSGT